MLTPIARRTPSPAGATPGHFAIVAARYNAEFTDALVAAAVTELLAAGAATVEVVRVPGSFEIPVAAAALARATRPRFDALLCFGAILRGKTSHAQQIADAVSLALAELQVHAGKPVIHGVLLFENLKQARERCFGTRHNRGLEAARAALEMAETMRGLARFKIQRPLAG